MTFRLSGDFKLSRKKVIGFLKEKRQSLPKREQVGLKNCTEQQKFRQLEEAA